MGIISFEKNAEIDFVPEYGGNRRSEDPTIVTMLLCTHGDSQEYTLRGMDRLKGADSDAAEITRISASIKKRQFLKHVIAVRNYSVTQKDQTQKIVTDPEEFYNTIPGKLLDEILSVSEDSARLNEGQAKNCLRVSDTEK